MIFSDIFSFNYGSASTMLNQIEIEFCHSRFTGMIVHVITFITLSLLLVFLHQNVGSTKKLLTLLIFILFCFDYYAISLRNCFYLVHKSHSNYKLYKKRSLQLVLRLALYESTKIFPFMSSTSQLCQHLTILAVVIIF